MNSKPWVINASPLIFLSEVNGLEWLIHLADRAILIPQAVLAEVAAGSGSDALIWQIEQNPGFLVAPNLPVPTVISAWDLGAGETQVLSHGLQSREGGRVLLDDQAARKCAQSLGLPVLGTLGVILIAKRRDWITAVRPVIEQLQMQKMYMSAALMQSVLKDAGEF